MFCSSKGDLIVMKDGWYDEETLIYFRLEGDHFESCAAPSDKFRTIEAILAAAKKKGLPTRETYTVLETTFYDRKKLSIVVDDNDITRSLTADFESGEVKVSDTTFWDRTNPAWRVEINGETAVYYHEDDIVRRLNGVARPMRENINEVSVGKLGDRAILSNELYAKDLHVIANDFGFVVETPSSKTSYVVNLPGEIHIYHVQDSIIVTSFDDDDFRFEIVN
jgi:hypothetical protein